ncbi:MAG: phosphatase PAP2 family protein [Acidimicrobiales bacterium]
MNHHQDRIEHELEELPPELVVRPAISILHRDPPLTAKQFFFHRKAVFAFTLSLSIGLAVLAAWDGGRVLLHLDDPVARWMAAHRTPVLTDVFNAASHLGDNTFIFATATLLALWTWSRCRYLAVALILAALFRPLLEFVLKAVVDRPRPDVEPLGTFRGPSHPSGHPLAAASLWGLVPAVVALHIRSRALWWAATVWSCTVVVAVAASRVYKGAHYLTDVTASLSWAALYLAAVQGFFDRYHGTKNCHHPTHEVQAEG